ncbi:MAG: hypothetical protein RID42_00360 [Alphaproteobacteria bacterium]
MIDGESDTRPDAKIESGTAAPPPSDWRESLGEDLREDATLARYDSLDALAHAYKDLERYQGRSVAVPRARDGEAAWSRLYDRLGRPKEAAGYDAPAIPDGVDVDGEILARAAEAAHKHGLNNRQYRGFVEDVLGFQSERAAAARSAQDGQRRDAAVALKQAWGARFDGNAEVARRAMRALGFPETTARDPAALAHFFSVGQALGEDTSIIGASHDGFSPSAQEARRRIDAIRGDPDHAFNKGDAPEHAAAVQDMEALYALVYGGDAPPVA